MATEYNYGKLIGKMREKKVTQSQIAGLMGISVGTLCGRFNNRTPFSQEEIESIVNILAIDPAEIPDYFFAH